jgi:hypothetical protein
MTDTHTEGRLRTEPQSAAGATLSEATDHAKEVTHHAGDEVGNVLDVTKQQARGLVEGARSRAAVEADSATSRAAEALAGTARDLTDLASGQGSPDTQAAQLERQAGERVDRAAAQLRDRGYQGVAEDVSRWARAHPGAFLAAAAGAGFVIGRVFRAADTQGVVDAAKGTPSGPQLPQGSDTPQLDAGDPSLFAEERRTEMVGAPTAGQAPMGSAPIDLTDQPSGPIAGV